MIPANVLVPLLALVTGWLALFAVRRTLGPIYYHIIAFPTGLLAWLVVAGLTTLLGLPFGPVVAACGHALFIVASTGIGLLLGGHTAVRHKVPWWSWLAWGAVFGTVSSLVARAGMTAVAFDSFTHYEVSGIALHDTGLLDPIIMSARGPLIPAMHAATRLAGGEWTYAPYTLLSLTTLALLLVVLFDTAFRALPRIPRAGLSVAMVVLLGLQASWTSHSFFVHSNMMSATYLLVAVVSLLGGAGYLGTPSSRIDDRLGVGWWIVAGIATVGLATARPDGYAYVYAVLALALVLHLRRPTGWRRVAALYGSLYAVTALVYIPVLATIGVWTSYKLQGSWVLALLGGSAVLGIATLLLPRTGSVAEWLGRPGTAIRLVAAVNIVAILPLTWVFAEEFRISVGNMIGNLMQTGGWGFLWYAILGFVLLSLLFRRVAPLGERGDLILFGLAQFFAVALVVHGVTHPGRLNWMDSFNRVSLHALPIAWWYVSLFLGSLLAGRER